MKPNYQSLYLGTGLHKRISRILNRQVKQDAPASELFRSTANQPYFGTVTLGLIGAGKIFGEVDAIKKRPHVYTLTSKTPNA